MGKPRKLTESTYESGPGCVRAVVENSLPTAIPGKPGRHNMCSKFPQVKP